jgi:hypothetical protein
MSIITTCKALKIINMCYHALFSGFKNSVKLENRKKCTGHYTSDICSVLLQEGTEIERDMSFSEVINGFCVGKSNGNYRISTDTQIKNEK